MIGIVKVVPITSDDVNEVFKTYEALASVSVIVSDNLENCFVGVPTIPALQNYIEAKTLND